MATVQMHTLRDIAAMHAKKMPEMVDQLTEESPILDVLKWQPTTHGLWNMTEEVLDIQGPGFVEMSAPLPDVNVATGLKKVDLQIMGGTLEASDDKLRQSGGAATYFAKRQPRILKKAGNDTEYHLYYKNWRPYAIANKNVIDAGGTGTGLTSIVVMRHDMVGCTGLYDQSAFDQGTLLRVDPINGGNLYRLANAPFAGVIGRGVMLKGYFGWQLMDPRTVSVIVNIDRDHKPTDIMVSEAVAKARGSASNTHIFCSPMTKANFLDPIVKMPAMNMNPGDMGVNTLITHWNNVPIVASYNLPDFAETRVII